ncbi:hypothetical protein KXX16_001993 [Aspergillus fumigatus]|nr:hypothetical protein KXX68_004849 [Aspergillus fumigatus]KAH1616201.1 hypothetical protein KXX31_001903 [Aspergillus fumigatus]KAH1644335.1 hypothetical protein KXX16_001993 [Aspergillus fumigatus]KAH1840112.1 hypothetical protein KXX43_009154 [Aspergillus fumigatus]KAH1969202.1 hypothetical protein KXV80_001391 [Aspergillus fumigatus]
MSGARSTRPSPESGFTKVTCIPGQPFDQEIRSALARLNLNFQVPHVDFAGGEVYLVGNEIGLSGRFINNVCVPVAKVLANSSQSSLVIGDVQAFLLTPEVVPDVSIGVTMKNDDGITEVKVVGEFKTFWTLELAELSVSDPISRVQLAPHLGQLVAQMRSFELRYGFLSTYQRTIFVKRTADFAFHVSRPLCALDTNLSVRQCFAGFCILAEQGYNYTEHADFKAERLRGQIDLQASVRQTPRRNHVAERSLVTGLTGNITPNSIILSDPRGALAILNVSRMISRPSETDKAIFEIDQQGTRYIVKCWGPKLEKESNAECAVYERLSESRPGGYDVFANIILAGNILCSSLFPDGRALVLPYRDGQILGYIWDELDIHERTHVREECEKAIHILRSLSIYVPDAGKHNVLFDRQTGTVTMLDFETAIECPQSEHMPYVELLSLFGDSTMRGRARGGQ